MKEIKDLVTRDEIRRLEKAAREKDKRHLVAWAKQFEEQIRVEYEKAFEAELEDAIHNYLVAIVYSLHFSEITKFGNKRINEFISDVFATVDMFRRKEYHPDEYIKILEKEGITMLQKEKE